jgi:hypothetical protein
MILTFGTVMLRRSCRLFVRMENSFAPFLLAVLKATVDTETPLPSPYAAQNIENKDKAIIFLVKYLICTS